VVARLVGIKDLVDRLGPERWAEWWRRLHAHITKEIEWFRGREIDILENRLLAIFDGPARAIRCASAIGEYASRLGVQTCTGLHTGECEVMGNKLGGIAVHIGARIAALARPGEVLVSSTVKDLVAGSGLSFQDRGIQTLKGVADHWHLLAAGR